MRKYVTPLFESIELHENENNPSPTSNETPSAQNVGSYLSKVFGDTFDSMSELGNKVIIKLSGTLKEYSLHIDLKKGYASDESEDSPKTIYSLQTEVYKNDKKVTVNKSNLSSMAGILKKAQKSAYNMKTLDQTLKIDSNTQFAMPSRNNIMSGRGFAANK